MDELRVGDLVPALSASGQVVSTPVIGFMHVERNTTEEMIELRGSAFDPVVASALHQVFVSKDMHSQPVSKACAEVEPGEFLWVSVDGRLLPGKVHTRSKVLSVGLFGPLTAQGNVFVNNVLFSVYTDDHNWKHNVYAIYRHVILPLWPDTPGRLPGDLEWIVFSKWFSSNVWTVRCWVVSGLL
jgi:hypothetical protein